jgi:hypothetical protein
MANLALAEVSKSDLVDRLERLRAQSRNALAKARSTSKVQRSIGVLAASAGGAACAAAEHFAAKGLKPNLSQKVPLAMSAAMGLAAAFYDGPGDWLVYAAACGANGYVSGTETKRVLP